MASSSVRNSRTEAGTPPSLTLRKNSVSTRAYAPYISLQTITLETGFFRAPGGSYATWPCTMPHPAGLKGTSKEVYHEEQTAGIHTRWNTARRRERPGDGARQRQLQPGVRCTGLRCAGIRRPCAGLLCAAPTRGLLPSGAGACLLCTAGLGCHRLQWAGLEAPPPSSLVIRATACRGPAAARRLRSFPP